ncbi:MAG: aminodeoxychorismate synthase component I [Saprospiraceae bacterium]
MKIHQPYSKVIEDMNLLQSRSEDFVFAFNYAKTSGFCLLLNEVDKSFIDFSINHNHKHSVKPSFNLEISHISYQEYLTSYNKIIKEIENGNSYLCNLTFKTPILVNLDLQQIFELSYAKYKLWIKDEFTVFSPERFVRIENDRIYTNPMKGTIDASIDNAENLLRTNLKELSEHTTIVDLLRNDLSIVSLDVKVDRFQYMEKIQKHNGGLIQMSSQISGNIRSKFKNEYGSLMDLITPAGSICGAPKEKTCQIISDVESYERGYYTGIFGTYQAGILDCAVMIRFIENDNGQLFFKSGGGIHSLSNPIKEYEEMKSKIYVPIF